MTRVGESVESALSALAAIFLAHSAYFNNFRQKIPYFDASRQKRVLFNCFATKQCLGLASLVEYANPHFKRVAEFLGLDTVHA